MNVIFEWIGYLFGYIIQFAQLIFKNYGLAIIFFTVFSRILLFPFTISQQKTQAAQARLQPKVEALKQKYGNDRNALAQAQQELYQKEGVSQLGGCLPMLIQMPFLLGLYQAISKPFSCVLHIGKDIMDRAYTLFNLPPASSGAGYSEITIINALRAISEQGSVMINRLGTIVSVPDMPGAGNFAAAGSHIARYSAATVLDGYKTVSAAQVNAIFGEKTAESVFKLSNSFGFFGIDLLQTPSLTPMNLAVIMSVIVFICAAGGMILSNRLTKAAAPQMQGCSPNVMAIAMGAMSTVFSFTVPSALALYWATSSALAPAQSVITQKYFGPIIINAKAEAQRIARLKLGEKAIIDEITSAKGELKLEPMMPAEAESKPQNNQNPAPKKKNPGKGKKKR